MSQSEKTVAMLGGSFDPVTLAHQALVWEGSRLFDIMHIVIGVNPAKKYLLDDNRDDLVRAVVDDMRIKGCKVHVHRLQGRLLAHLATELGVTHLLRGVRDSVDFAYEEKATAFNRKIIPNIRTMYLRLPDMDDVSSSAVKEAFGLDGWESVVAPMVHPLVLDALRRKHLANLKLAA